MFNAVDYIGVEAVCSIIKQTDLKRFVIYRQGAGKGSTPVFDCSHTTNNSAAVKTFKDWAENMCRFNPNNFLCYDLLLFNDYEEALVDEQNRNPHEEKSTGRKRGKIRFSFALNAQGVNQNYGGTPMNNLNIQETIDTAVRNALQAKELAELRQRVKELEEEEEEEEEESKGTQTDWIGQLIKSQFLQNADTINGDLGTMSEDKTKKKNLHGFSDEDVKKKMESVNKALKVLWKHNKQLDVDLSKLAKLAEDEPEVFKLILGKLRAF